LTFKKYIYGVADVVVVVVVVVVDLDAVVEDGDEVGGRKMIRRWIGRW
jgi:hypothetical protein